MAKNIAKTKAKKRMRRRLKKNSQLYRISKKNLIPMRTAIMKNLSKLKTISKTPIEQRDISSAFNI